MRIVIQSGANETILCGGDESSQYPENLRVNGRRIAQIAEFIRAAHAGVYNRKNRRVRISFQLTREYEFAWIAAEALLVAAAELPETGTVLFTCQGGGRKVLQLVDAVIESDDAYLVGVSVITSYNLIGKKFEVST
jgi:hypothetical protein